ncbi:WecB/TagA/CpsF family glycosyltransferase [Methylibium sp.]|uniref:WecB/TagA/CpsF family glycosyltransferase n=1 Tax=Methylibium sp. TaxID=2067992 RepID=UPI003D1193D1
MSQPNFDAQRHRVRVLGIPIDAVSWASANTTIARWAAQRESRYVCICNVHSVVTAARETAFGAVVEHSDLATPDGAPVAWMLRRLGCVGQARINGPDLMSTYCGQAAARGESLFLYGGTEATLARLTTVLRERYPGIRIAGTISPPFRPLSAAEDEDIVKRINESGAGVVWVGLGCPKQELWMAAHRGRVHAVMIGVGAAFDYLAGTVPRAPRWMQHAGLEWAHRLASEPRRLWRRYLVTNTLFLLGAVRQLTVHRFSRKP